MVQSIARVLKSFHNNCVSLSEEAIESQCNRLAFKWVTKILSLIRAFSVLNQGVGLDLSKLLSLLQKLVY